MKSKASIKFLPCRNELMNSAVWGRLSDFDGHVPRQSRPWRVRILVLHRSGTRLHLHARPCRHCSRPLDTGATHIESVPSHSQRVHDNHRLLGLHTTRCRRSAGVRTDIHAVHHFSGILHANYRTEQFGGLQRS